MTNGFNKTVVESALMRVGWKQPTTKGYDIVSTDNQNSDSGRYYNDDSFHTAVSIENIYDCQRDKDITDDEFNAYLLQLQKSVILQSLNLVFDKPQFIESGLIFRKIESTQHNPIVNNGNFVGIRLQVAPGDYGVSLKNAILLFDGAVDFPLYLFNSLTNGTDTIADVLTDVPYIKKWSVSAKANTQTVVPLNYDLNYSNDVAKGGVWFLGYFQSDLGSVKALDYNPCTNCYKVVGAVSFESKAISNTDFNREIYGKSAGMYGLNLEFSSYADLTESIVNSAHLFDNLQGLMMSAKVIELIKNSTRENVNRRISSESINSWFIDLKGLKTDTGQWIPGIESAISKEVAKIQQAYQKTVKTITVTTVR